MKEITPFLRKMFDSKEKALKIYGRTGEYTHRPFNFALNNVVRERVRVIRSYKKGAGIKDYSLGKLINHLLINWLQNEDNQMMFLDLYTNNDILEAQKREDEAFAASKGESQAY